METNKELAIQQAEKILRETGISIEDFNLSWESSKSVSRSKSREKFANAVDLSQEDVATLDHLFEVLQSVIIKDPSEVTEDQFDFIADEVLTIRKVEDMLGGRIQALRAHVFDIVNKKLEWNGKDPERDSGYIYSEEYGVRLSKEVSGGKPKLDVTLLEKVLDFDQFRSVTDHVVIMKTVNTADGKHTETTESYYEINEPALEKQLQLGNIGMEQLIQATIYTPRKTAFYVRDGRPEV